MLLHINLGGFVTLLADVEAGVVLNIVDTHALKIVVLNGSVFVFNSGYTVDACPVVELNITFLYSCFTPTKKRCRIISSRKTAIQHSYSTSCSIK